MFTTGGTTTDNLAISPTDIASYTITAPQDPRLPGGGGYAVGPLYDINPNVFGQSDLLVQSTKKIGDDTREFNGIDATFNVRNVKGVTFQGGTSTGKVTNDFCDIRSAVPEATVGFGISLLTMPFCHQESPWQTSFNALVTYMIPRIEVNVSSVFQDKPNVSVDQLGSLAANYTLSAADLADAAAQIGRPLTATPPLTINLLSPGQMYGDRIRQWDFSAKKVIRLGGQRLTVGADIYNLLNNNVTLAFNPTFIPNAPGWQSPTTYMNPRVFRLNADTPGRRNSQRKFQ